MQGLRLPWQILSSAAPPNHVVVVLRRRGVTCVVDTTHASSCCASSHRMRVCENVRIDITGIEKQQAFGGDQWEVGCTWVLNFSVFWV